MQERRKAADLAAQNQLLQQHLQETTSSFREALQLVESLMGGDPPLESSYRAAPCNSVQELVGIGLSASEQITHVQIWRVVCSISSS